MTRLLALILVITCSACARKEGLSKSTKADASEAQTSSIAEKNTQKQHPKFISTEDLPAIQKRNHIRVLVYRSGENFLPRRGMPASRDREMATELGKHIGVEVEFIVVEEFGRLIPMLLGGEGDLIAAQMTVDDSRRKQVAFTRPTLVVDEMVVGLTSEQDNPTNLKSLSGKSLYVRDSSSYAMTIRRLNQEQKLDIRIDPASENQDAENLVYAVTRKTKPLTAVDSHILKAIRTYNPDAKGLFPLTEDREIAWAVRPKNKKLLAAANSVVMENAMTVHQNEIFVGDLAEIKKRGVIRVLTANNPISYFLYRGQQFGFDYELSRMLAKELGVRLELVVPPTFGELIPWLKEGRGDMIAASLTRTPKRESQVRFSRRYLEVQELVVQPKGQAPLANLSDLAGRTIHVRRTSSYFERLKTLQATGVKFKIVETPEEQDTETLVDLVSQNKIPLTVADSHFVQLMKNFGAPIQASLSLNPKSDAGVAGHSKLAFATRKTSEELGKHLDRFVRKVYRGVEFNVARKRYFGAHRKYKKAQVGRSKNSKVISPYDVVIKKYASRYGFDWRLMSAQAYAESRFNPKAKSWVGALGLFQVMPKTGAAMGFTDLQNPEVGTHAGIKYMSRLMKRFDKSIPFRQRVRFALAAYNAGLGHVFDARRLAKEKGWDPDRWFGNVEKAMLLLKEPKYARAARHGYCRGTEPVKYVSKIQSYYEAYVKVVK